MSKLEPKQDGIVTGSILIASEGRDADTSKSLASESEPTQPAVVTSEQKRYPEGETKSDRTEVSGTRSPENEKPQGSRRPVACIGYRSWLVSIPVCHGLLRAYSFC